MSAAPDHAPIGLSAVPYDVDAEQALLGACLNEQKNIPVASALLESLDFYDPLHRRLWETIITLDAAQMAVTPLTVHMRMRDDPGLQEVGGMAYLAALCGACPAFMPISDTAKNLSELAIRRTSMAALVDAHEAIANRTSNIIEVLKPVVDVADKAASKGERQNFTPITDAAAAMLKRAEEVASGKPIVAATTGLKCLDEAIGGLQGGDMVVYAGRPGMGKSALLMTTALRTAMTGRPVIFFSLEMTQERLLQRIGCDLDFDEHSSQPISYSWFRNGSARHHDIARMAEAMRRVPGNLAIHDRGDLSIQEIAALARGFASRSTGGMGLVVIDYLQKVTAGDRYRGNRVQEVTEISGGAKTLAMQLKWPVVLGAQLNRGVESREEKRPTLTDLRESGSIEQDADVVIGLFRPGYYIEKRKPALGRADPSWGSWEGEWETEKNRLDLLVLKNRNGPEDSLSVFCDMRASAIRDERR